MHVENLERARERKSFAQRIEAREAERAERLQREVRSAEERTGNAARQDTRADG